MAKMVIDGLRKKILCHIKSVQNPGLKLLLKKAKLANLFGDLRKSKDELKIVINTLNQLIDDIELLAKQQEVHFAKKVYSLQYLKVLLAARGTYINKEYTKIRCWIYIIKHRLWLKVYSH